MSLSRHAAFAALLAAFTLGPTQFAAAADNAPPACGGRDITVGVNLAAARAARADELTDGKGLLWRVEPSLKLGQLACQRANLRGQTGDP